MSDNEIYPDDPTLELDDDVEGHGLKEVAAGLGAAAVLAGGAAGATQLANTSTDVHASKAGPGISVQITDPIGTAMDLTDSTIAAAQAERDALLATADGAVTSTAATARTVPGTVDRTVDRTTGLAQDTVAWSVDVANASKQAAKDIAANTTGLANSTASSTTTTAATTATGAKATVNTTASTADRKVATVLNVTTTTAANGVHTAVVTLRAVDGGAGVNTAGGWVIVKAGDQVLAQVQVHGGSATASWTMPVLGGHSVDVSYTGDNAFAPSLRAIAL